MRALGVIAAVAACARARAPACSGTLPLGDGVAAPLTERSHEPAIIDSIAIAGAPAVAALARRVVASRPGQAIGDAPIADDVRRLWSLGLFADIRVEARETGAVSYLAHERYPRVAVVFAVTPRPLVDRVRIEGAGARDPELRRMRWLAGTPFEPPRVARMAANLELAFVRDGHVDATVAVRRARALGVALCVIAEPGPRVTVGRITFPGRHVVTRAALLAALDGQHVNHPGEPYDADALALDEPLMIAPYYERGRIDATIGSPRVSRHGRHLDVAIPIAEGPEYRLGRVRVDGGRRPPPELVPGAVFARSRLLAAIATLEAELGPGAAVTPVTANDRAARRIDIRLEIEWRPPWRALHWLPWL